MSFLQRRMIMPLHNIQNIIFDIFVGNKPAEIFREIFIATDFETFPLSDGMKSHAVVISQKLIAIQMTDFSALLFW